MVTTRILSTALSPWDSTLKPSFLPLNLSVSIRWVARIMNLKRHTWATSLHVFLVKHSKRKERKESKKKKRRNKSITLSLRRDERIQRYTISSYSRFTSITQEQTGIASGALGLGNELMEASTWSLCCSFWGVFLCLFFHDPVSLTHSRSLSLSFFDSFLCSFHLFFSFGYNQLA